MIPAGSSGAAHWAPPPIHKCTCSPPSAFPELLFAVFLKCGKFATPARVKKVRKLEVSWHSIALIFLPFKGSSHQQLRKQDIYFICIWKKRGGGRWGSRETFSLLGIKDTLDVPHEVVEYTLFSPWMSLSKQHCKVLVCSGSPPRLELNSSSPSLKAAHTTALSPWPATGMRPTHLCSIPSVMETTRHEQKKGIFFSPNHL